MRNRISFRKKILFSTVLIGVSLMFSAGIITLLEIAASHHVRLPTDQANKHFRLNHIWQPNGIRTHKEWVAKNPDYNTPYTHFYNKQGWLETYDIAETKPPNTYRIFYLGDSFTEGTCPMDQSVPSRVETFLNKTYGNSGIDFEVINTGTSSYSPLIYYILLRYYIFQYDPDLIIINVDMTDDYDDWKYRKVLITDSKGDPWAVPPRNVYKDLFIETFYGVKKAGLIAKSQLFLYQNSYLYQWVREKFSLRSSRATIHDDKNPKELKNEKGPDRPYRMFQWCWYGWDESAEEEAAYTLGILDKIVKFCKSHDIKIMFTGVPHYWQYALNESNGKPHWSHRPHTELAKLAAKNKIPHLNSYLALKPFIDGKRQEEFYYKGDMHFNPKGYEIWAGEHIKEIIKPENKLLPPEVYR